MRFDVGDQNPAEFRRQANHQETGPNQLTIQDFISNRDDFLVNGRDPAGSAPQQAARNDAFANRADELVDDLGMTPEEAGAAATEWMSTQHALHAPDQVAGGFPSSLPPPSFPGSTSSFRVQRRRATPLLADTSP